MIRPSPVERLVMATARIIAGRGRGAWLDAMEAELHVLPAGGRLDWALGSLVASIKDRAAHDWPLALAVVALPATALAAVIPLSAFASVIARQTGTSTLALMPLVALAPLPFAVLLGTVRPRSSIWLKGVFGFLIYQAIPAVTLPLLIGLSAYPHWEANLGHYGLLPPSGLVGSLGMWLFGVWAGAQRMRRRGTPTPPSP